MKITLLFLLNVSFFVYAQHTDSIKVFQLNEVVVTANNGSADPLLEYYRLNTPVTTEDILSRTQSVQMIRRGNYGLEPAIRGFSAGQISLTIDGMHIQGACTDKMDPVTIYVEPQNLYRLDVSTSEDGSKFGSAIGGSINLELANPQFSSSVFNSSVGFQSASGSYNGNFSFNSGSDNLAVLINGVYRKSNSYRAGSGKTIPFSYYEKTNLSFSVKYNLFENGEFRTNILIDDGWNIGYPALPMDVGYAKARIYSLSYNLEKKNSLFSSFEGKVYANSVSHFMDDTKRPDIPMHMDMPGWSNTYGAYAQSEIIKGKNHVTEIRADFYRTDVRAEMTMYPEEGLPMFMLTLPDAYRRSLSLYLKHEWIVPGSFSVTANTRIENTQTKITSDFGRRQLDVFGFNTKSSINKLLASGNLSFSKYIDNKIILSASAGFTERNPTFNELFGFYLFNRYDGYDYAGNPGLKSEQSLQSELTVGYNAANIILTAAGFYYNIKNYIIGTLHDDLSAMTIGANGVKIFSNIPYAVITGSELSMNLTFDKIKTITTIKYTHGKDNNSEYLTQIAPLKVLSSVRYTAGRISLQGELEYAAAQDNVRKSAGEQTTPQYVLFNSRISYALPFDSYLITINAGAENIFDINYRDHLDWGNIPRPGRNVYVSFSFSYY